MLDIDAFTKPTILYCASMYTQNGIIKNDFLTFYFFKIEERVS